MGSFSRNKLLETEFSNLSIILSDRTLPVDDSTRFAFNIIKHYNNELTDKPLDNEMELNAKFGTSPDIDMLIHTIGKHVSADSVYRDFIALPLAAAEEYGGRLCYKKPSTRTSISKRSAANARSMRRKSKSQSNRQYRSRIGSKQHVLRGGAPEDISSKLLTALILLGAASLTVLYASTIWNSLVTMVVNFLSKEAVILEECKTSWRWAVDSFKQNSCEYRENLNRSNLREIRNQAMSFVGVFLASAGGTGVVTMPFIFNFINQNISTHIISAIYYLVSGFGRISLNAIKYLFTLLINVVVGMRGLVSPEAICALFAAARIKLGNFIRATYTVAASMMAAASAAAIQAGRTVGVAVTAMTTPDDDVVANDSPTQSPITEEDLAESHRSAMASLATSQAALAEARATVPRHGFTIAAAMLRVDADQRSVDGHPRTLADLETARARLTTAPTGAMFAAPPTEAMFPAPPTGAMFAAPPTGAMFAAPPTAELQQSRKRHGPGIGPRNGKKPRAREESSEDSDLGFGGMYNPIARSNRASITKKITRRRKINNKSRRIWQSK